MLKIFLKITDDFLSSSIKHTFLQTENRYKKENLPVDLQRELNNFQENPLGCMIGINSKFETNIKLKIKFILGFFFVLVPLVVFTLFSYIIEISATYGVLGTFVIAILVASRFEELSTRYVQTRILKI